MQMFDSNVGAFSKAAWEGVEDKFFVKHIGQDIVNDLVNKPIFYWRLASMALFGIWNIKVLVGIVLVLKCNKVLLKLKKVIF